MNPLNYASLEASQRLYKAGIVLETEFAWQETPNIARITPMPKPYNPEEYYRDIKYTPAPSMAEVTRELLTKLGKTKYIRLGLQGNGFFADIAMSDCDESSQENITDCLIDLLIWVAGQKRKEKL